MDSLPQSGLDMAHEMDDVAEQLNLLEPADFAAVTVAVQVIPREIEEHRVFCIFLLTRLQFLDGLFILLF